MSWMKTGPARRSQKSGEKMAKGAALEVESYKPHL